ncbi:MAG: divalent metal cation transporter, partial [Deltaproteobacteria bacterium]
MFALALLCSGQASTLTGTLAGQIVMEGFLRFKIRPFLRRLLTRMLAVIPAAATILYLGHDATYKLLILSQVILSLQLPFAIIPLIHFTSDKTIMEDFANRYWVQALSWLIAAIIVGLNAKLVLDQLHVWISTSAAPGFIYATVVPLVTLLGGLLLYITLRPFVRLPTREAFPAWKKISQLIRA